MAEVTALDNLRDEGYVNFYKDSRYPLRTLGTEQCRQVKQFMTQALVMSVADFLLQNPGIGSWDGTVRRTSTLRIGDVVEYRYMATVHSLNPYE